MGSASSRHTWFRHPKARCGSSQLTLRSRGCDHDSYAGSCFPEEGSQSRSAWDSLGPPSCYSLQRSSFDPCGVSRASVSRGPGCDRKNKGEEVIRGTPGPLGGTVGTPASGDGRRKAAALRGLGVSALWYSRGLSSIQSLSLCPLPRSHSLFLRPSPRLDLASRTTIVPATLASHSLVFILPNLLSFLKSLSPHTLCPSPVTILSNAATALSSTVV